MEKLWVDKTLSFPKFTDVFVHVSFESYCRISESPRTREREPVDDENQSLQRNVWEKELARASENPWSVDSGLLNRWVSSGVSGVAANSTVAHPFFQKNFEHEHVSKENEHVVSAPFLACTRASKSNTFVEVKFSTQHLQRKILSCDPFMRRRAGDGRVLLKWHSCTVYSG